MEQWEENVSAADAGGQEAFVVTRRQRALEETQLRADDSLSKKRPNVRVQRKEICKLSLRERYRKRKVRRIPRMILR